MPRSFRALVGGGAILLLLNTAYIAADASPTVFYAANVLLHVGLGLLVWLGALVLAWRDRELRDHVVVRVALVLLSGGGALALGLIQRGNLAEMRWALVGHIVCGGLAAALFAPVVYRLAARESAGGRRVGAAFAASAAALVVAPIAAT